MNNEELLTINLSDQKLAKIPKRILKKSKKVRVLVLRNCHIKEFPREILEFSELESISLQNNEISYLPSEISTLGKLKTIDLRGTKIEQMPNSMKDLKHLELILMYDNDLSDYSKNKIKCTLPPKCEIMFSREYREYPPYECDNTVSN